MQLSVVDCRADVGQARMICGCALWDWIRKVEMCNVGIEDLGGGRIVGCLGTDKAGISQKAELLCVRLRV